MCFQRERTEEKRRNEIEKEKELAYNQQKKKKKGSTNKGRCLIKQQVQERAKNRGGFPKSLLFFS
jgi:hypothetical protein